MKSKMVFGLIVFFAIAIAGISFVMNNGQSSTHLDASDIPGSNKNFENIFTGPVRPVKVMQLTISDQHSKRSFPGILKAAKETNLSFRVGGPLIEFDANIGQEVEKGETIARIDPRDYEINILKLKAAVGEAHAKLKAMRKGARKEDIELLKADLSAARAQFKEAELNFLRHENLYNQKATAKASFDSVKAGYDMAKARLDAAKQALQKGESGAREEDIEAMEAVISRLDADMKDAKNALNDTMLKAPFKGFIRSKFVENYETVSAGRPIVSLIDSSSVEVQVVIPEKLRIRNNDFISFSCEIEAYPGRKFEGLLKEIGQITERSNQGYPLTIKIDVPENISVHPGMAVTLTINSLSKDKKGDTFRVPVSAVYYDENGSPCIWKLDHGQMVVRKNPVILGSLTGNFASLISGARNGDIIVIAGAQFLREGQKVSVLNKSLENK